MATLPGFGRIDKGEQMNRFTHLLFGDGVLIESPHITESGKSVCLVRFDASETTRLILTDSLKPSSLAPGEPVKKPRRKVVKQPRARKADPTDEPISDKLLVPELDDTLANAGEPETDETQALEAM
jgi:hypothetical protein